MNANGRMIGRLDRKSVLLLRMCFVGIRFWRREIRDHFCVSLCRCDKIPLSTDLELLALVYFSGRIYLTLKGCNCSVLPSGHMLWMLASKSS